MWIRVQGNELVNSKQITSIKVIDEDTIAKLVIYCGEKEYLYEGNAEETLQNIMNSEVEQRWVGN